MDQSTREILTEITNILGHLDRDDGSKVAIDNIKLQLKGLELVARLKKAQKESERTPWIKKLHALQPLITAIILIALIVINILGIEFDAARILP